MIFAIAVGLGMRQEWSGVLGVIDILDMNIECYW